MMSRTYATVPGLSYADLDATLRNIGYQREDQRDKVLYTHPDNSRARIVFSPFEEQEAVRGIDLFAARQIADSFGIFDAKDFDLMLIRVTEGRMPALA